MKGVILCGGKGTRLFPSTLVTSKQLIPIYDKPMVYYPLSTLMLAGVDDFIIICNQEHLDLYKKLLANGSQLGIKISYVVQKEPLGLAHGLKITEDLFKDYPDDEPFIFALGDNVVISDDIESIFEESIKSIKSGCEASIFALEVSNPSDFGVITFRNDEPIEMTEKPLNSSSNWAIPGFYVYKKSVFNYINKLIPSKRGELEITDLNKLILDEKKLNVIKFGRATIWYDAGSFDDLFEITEIIKNLYKRSGKIIGCIEEIAISKKLVEKKDIRILNPNSSYYKYIKNILNK